MLEHNARLYPSDSVGSPQDSALFRARRHGFAPCCAGGSLASTVRGTMGSGCRWAALARMVQPDCRVLQVSSIATLAHVVDASTKRQRPVITLDSHSPRLGADLNRQPDTAEGGMRRKLSIKKQKAGSEASQRSRRAEMSAQPVATMLESQYKVAGDALGCRWTAHERWSRCA